MYHILQVAKVEEELNSQSARMAQLMEVQMAAQEQ
jgi:hypothetical protein